jgi:PAS domain S-box-containing protein
MLSNANSQSSHSHEHHATMSWRRTLDLTPDQFDMDQLYADAPNTQYSGPSTLDSFAHTFGAPLRLKARGASTYDEAVNSIMEDSKATQFPSLGWEPNIPQLQVDTNMLTMTSPGPEPIGSGVVDTEQLTYDASDSESNSRCYNADANSIEECFSSGSLSPTAASSAPNQTAVFPFLVVPEMQHNLDNPLFTPSSAVAMLPFGPRILVSDGSHPEQVLENIPSIASSPVTTINGSVNAGSALTEVPDSTGVTAMPDRPRKRSNRTLTPEEYEQRKDRHNKLEIKRRKLINDSFSQLQSLTNSANESQSVTLRAAISKLKAYEREVQRLETLRKRKRAEVEATTTTAAAAAAAAAATPMPPRISATHSATPLVTTSIVTEEDTIKSLKRVKLDDNNALAVSDSAETKHPPANGPVVSPWSTMRLDNRAAFLNSGAPMAISMLNGSFVDVNDAYASMLKNTRGFISNLSVFTITHPDFVPKRYQMMNNLLTGTSETESAQDAIVDCEGQILSVHCVCWVVRDDDGNATRVASIMTPLVVQIKTKPVPLASPSVAEPATVTIIEE